MEISVKEFMKMQPNNPRVTEADKYYVQLAALLAKRWDNAHRFTSLSDNVRQAVVLAVVGYFQDVVSDAGIWRSFTMMHEHLYGAPLPFYGRSDDYIDYELNLDDLRFIIWYTLEGQHYENFTHSPLDADIEWLAKLFFKTLDNVYESAPEPVEYNIKTGIDPDDVDDANRIYELSYWLFYHCYFMKHAAKLTIAQNMMETRDLLKEKPRDVEDKIKDLFDRTMLSAPTGPLSLSIGAWVQMIATGELPKDEATATNAEPHHLYTDLLKANDGKEIAFFATHDDLVAFLTGPMQWEQQEGGLIPHLKEHHNFVVLANPERGLLIAPDVAQFVAHPDNAQYDQEEAAKNAHTLVTEYGRCPKDLVKYLFEHNLLPDAVLPGDKTRSLLHENWDFLLRLYQQGLYND